MLTRKRELETYRDRERQLLKIRNKQKEAERYREK